jgi:hypothetical protein
MATKEIITFNVKLDGDYHFKAKASKKAVSDLGININETVNDNSIELGASINAKNEGSFIDMDTKGGSRKTGRVKAEVSMRFAQRRIMIPTSVKIVKDEQVTYVNRYIVVPKTLNLILVSHGLYNTLFDFSESQLKLKVRPVNLKYMMKAVGGGWFKFTKFNQADIGKLIGYVEDNEQKAAEKRAKRTGGSKPKPIDGDSA